MKPIPIVDKRHHSLIRKWLNKLMRFPLNLYYNQYYRSHPDLPWLPPTAIHWLEEYLTKDHVGFEWGSGRSTLFFSKRCKEIVSIEHEGAWYNQIKNDIDEKMISNVEYKFVPPSKEAGLIVKNDHWKITGHVPDRPEFRSYFEAILDWPDHCFDFVVVDGRARVACSLNAVDKIKPGGILIFDNTEREDYQTATQYLEKSGWQNMELPCWISQTTIMTKPKLS